MGDEPEVWISDGPGSADPRRLPDQDPGHDPGRGRWIALIAGFAAVLAIIAVQHFAGSAPDADTAPAPGVSVTTAPTTSGPTTATSVASTPTTLSGETTVLTTIGDDGALVYSPTVVATTTTSADPTPSTSTADPMPLRGEPFELVGFQWPGAVSFGASAVVRYRSSTGELVTTPVPSLMSNGGISFAVTDDATIIRPWDHVPAYVVPDGKPAEVATGVLAQTSQVLPADRPGRLWVAAPDSDNLTLVLVDGNGHPTGPTITPPATLGVPGIGYGSTTTDGAGYVLVRAISGIYDLRPGEIRRVTTGTVLAAGPTGYLVYECDESARCAAALVDRATHSHTALRGYTPTGSPFLGQVQGIIAPDGRHAVVLDYSGGLRVALIDLHTGASKIAGTNLNSQASMWGSASSLFVFTPDSRTLLVAADGGVDAFDPATGELLGRLPLPPLAAIAIRPVR